MSEAWWCPAISIPGETIDGVPMNRLILTERARKGSLLVDGDRQALRQRGPELQRPRAYAAELQPERVRVPAHPGVADLRRTRTARSYRLGPLSKRDADPEWLAKGDTLAALAAEIGLPADALEATVERFNEGAAAR